MNLTRRYVLSGVGSAVVAGVTSAGRPAGAMTIVTPPIALLAQRLTQGGWARGQAGIDLALDLDSRAVAKDERGFFFIAFDRDAPATAKLTGRRPNGWLTMLPLTITPRSWPIERIDAPLRPPSLPDEVFQRIRAAELAQIAAARAQVTGAEGWRQPMIRPAPGRLSGRFGSQRIYRGALGAYHTGMDIAASAGTQIRAPADGVVVLAANSPFTLEGRLLLLDHGMGLNSAFLHCSAHMVKVGDAVRQGQPVAQVGMTGRATGPHLHWGLRWLNARLDPLLFLSSPG